MASWDFDRQVTSMRLLVEFAQEQGMDVRRALAGTRLQAAQLNDPQAVVSAAQELRLIRNMVETLGDETALGVALGQRYHFTAFGALGFAMISCQTLRDALDIGLRYFQLTFAFTRFVVEDGQDDTVVRLSDEELPPQLRRFIVERDLASFVTLQRDIFGAPEAIRALRFAYPAPRDQRAYADFFGVKPQFDQAETQVVLDRGLSLRRLPQANELARQAAEAQCRQMLQARGPRSGLAAEVRERIAAGLADGISMQRVAADLHMVPRTLRRRLAEQGTAYAELRDEVRQALAEAFLSGPQLSVEQIATRLGYAESTSFINAFRRWHGRSPHAWRLDVTRRR